MGGLVSVGPELQDAIAEVVRSEIARSLPVTPGSARSPRTRPDPRRSGHTQSRRRLHYSSQASDGEYSGGASPHGASPWRPQRDATPRFSLPRQTLLDYVPRGEHILSLARLRSTISTIGICLTVKRTRWRKSRSPIRASTPTVWDRSRRISCIPLGTAQSGEVAHRRGSSNYRASSA